jgi:hypothetical protein
MVVVVARAASLPAQSEIHSATGETGNLCIRKPGGKHGKRTGGGAG